MLDLLMVHLHVHKKLRFLIYAHLKQRVLNLLFTFVCEQLHLKTLHMEPQQCQLFDVMHSNQ